MTLTETCDATPAERLVDVGPALAEAADRYGTPAYVTDVTALHALAAEVEHAFPAGWQLNYSLKANPLPAVVAELAGRGWGANVVSAGEWQAASEAGVPNDRVTLEGIGKTDRELRAVVRAAADGNPLRWVALESVEEAARLAELCRAHGSPRTPVDVLLRLNPQVTPETHRGLAVGAAVSKFGMYADEVRELAASGPFGGGVRLRGVHVHVGSQLTDVTAWSTGARAGVELVRELADGRPSCDTVDLGGGFPAAGDGIPAPGDFAAAFLRGTGEAELPARVAIEPGRRPVAAAGWLLASVLHVRRRGDGQQVVLDAGMTELLRPALYGARHEIHPLRVAAGGAVATTVEGPVCESADTLGVHRLPPLARGDLVAIEHAGAYGSALSSRYNGRPAPPEVFLDGEGTLRLVEPGGLSQAGWRTGRPAAR